MKIFHLSEVDSPLGLAHLTLDRDEQEWVYMDPDLPILHIAAGVKFVTRADHSLTWPEWDGEKDDIPRASDSVGGIIAVNFLEHLREPYHFLEECGRVLAPGCPLNVGMPHPDSNMYKQDLDHAGKAIWVLDTWKTLLENPYYDKDKNRFPFRVTSNFTYSIKEENTIVVSQLVKTEG